jgi:hypothetical protein
MSVFDALLLDAHPIDIWITLRADGLQGSGTASDPFAGGVALGPAISILLTPNAREGMADSGDREHGFSEVNLGPGEFLTRCYGPHWAGGWQPKSGQKIVGCGFEVTTLKLLGAGVVDIGEEEEDLVEQHYHAIGTPIIPPAGSTTDIMPLEHFEVSNLTIDCNLDNQPLRDQQTFSPVACGAVRVLGSHCRVHNVKTINWGTKSLKEGCFVISIIGASGAPSDGVFGPPGNPILTEKDNNGIEDCIAIEPARNCARETTVLHLVA